ncbi:MAG: hypothetical protein ACPGQL_10605 [Thermoplasmatota archaeon]
MRHLFIPCLLLLVGLAGCLDDAEEQPTQDVDEPVSAGPLPEGVLLEERVPGGGTHLIPLAAEAPSAHGFHLPANKTEWRENGIGWLETNLHVQAYGNVTDWALLVFSEGGDLLHVLAADDEVLLSEVYGAFVGLLGLDLEGRTSVRLVDFDGRPQGLRVVAAGQGDGGLAVRMDPSPEQELAEMLRGPVGLADVIGSTDCYSVAGYQFIWAFLALGLGFRYGDIEVEQLLPDMEANKVVTILTEAPEGCAGWHHASALFIAYQGAFAWDAHVTGDGPERFRGVTVYEANTLNAATLVTGIPVWRSLGPNAAGFGSSFEVNGVSNDLIELYDHHQVTLGAPLEQLIRTPGAFEQGAAYGLAGELPVPPTIRFAGQALHLDFTTPAVPLK